MLSIQALADQALRRRDIAVRLHIHSPHRLKRTLLYFFFQLRKKLRVIFFQKLIDIGLGMGVFEIRIPVHKAHLNQDGSGVFLHCMDPPPVIGNVKVGMPHKGHSPGSAKIPVPVNMFLNVSAGFLRPRKTVIIHQIQGMVQFPDYHFPVFLMKVFTVRNIQQQGQVIVKGQKPFLQLSNIGSLKNLPAPPQVHGIEISLVIRF